MVHCSETTDQRRGAAAFLEPHPLGCGPPRGIRRSHSVRSLKAAAQLFWLPVRSLKAAAQVCLHSHVVLKPHPLGCGSARGIRHPHSVRSLKAAAQLFWLPVRSLKAAAERCDSARAALDNQCPLPVVALDVCDCVVQSITVAQQSGMVPSRPRSSLHAHGSQSVGASAFDDVHQSREVVSRDIGYEMTVYRRYGGHNKTMISSEQLSQDTSDYLESRGVEANRLSGEVILSPLMQFLIFTAERLLRVQCAIASWVARQPGSVRSPGDEVAFKHGPCLSSSVERGGARSRSVRSLKAAAQIRLHSHIALEPHPLGCGPSCRSGHSHSVRSLKAAAQVKGGSDLETLCM